MNTHGAIANMSLVPVASSLYNTLAFVYMVAIHDPSVDRKTHMALLGVQNMFCILFVVLPTAIRSSIHPVAKMYLCLCITVTQIALLMLLVDSTTIYVSVVMYFLLFGAFAGTVAHIALAVIFACKICTYYEEQKNELEMSV